MKFGTCHGNVEIMQEEKIEYKCYNVYLLNNKTQIIGVSVKRPLSKKALSYLAPLYKGPQSFGPCVKRPLCYVFGPF